MDHTIALIQKSHEGDKAAREQLVEENVGLIWCVVKRFYGRGLENEDLFQIGSIGLLKAIDKFDLSYDVKFSTYAVPMISGEIKRFLRDDGMIKVSRTLKELSYKIFQKIKAKEFRKNFYKISTYIQRVIIFKIFICNLPKNSYNSCRVILTLYLFYFYANNSNEKVTIFAFYRCERIWC